MKAKFLIIILSALVAISCKKNTGGGNPNPPPPPEFFSFNSLLVNGLYNGFNYYGIPDTSGFLVSFSSPVNRSTVNNAVTIRSSSGTLAPFTTQYQKNDSAILIRPSSKLSPLTKYTFTVSADLKSVKGSPLQSSVVVNFLTNIDSTDKFPRISDEQLLDLVQKQTFKYFWDFAHPVSGLARERNTSGETVTSGGSGFGIMSIPVAISRSFITRSEGLARMQKIVDFLKNKAQKFHGAFPHWMNGTTGAVQPFSQKDDGADLVETSFLMQGLLTARQYFDGTDAAETNLRADINTLWNGVEWNFFRQNNQNVLYWHWSPNYQWEMNHQIRGWNEALITYVLAASSTTYTIPKIVYDNGWAVGSNFINNNSYFNIKLPLGPAYGGPLFFAHYSFLGLNPNGLKDTYADYQMQNHNHTLINYNYCKANPKGFFGYSDQNWGLTASDDLENGYLAHSPTVDNGVISPTAAVSSIPYAPAESMRAIRFFYYTLGDKLWKDYGFVDAFSLKDAWFADSFLAIDQGPMIVMIENYRSQLLWNLFMSCPEIKAGLQKLGFTSPFI
ncbi:MAG TPA: glucoamylase family protein [Chitinophagaceae bacterium]|nr:glucoamylase family protein [Chitinophagaceae bacterium]